MLLTKHLSAAIDFHSMDINVYSELFDYHHSSKYRHSTDERNLYMFEIIEGEYIMTILIFGWTIPLIHVKTDKQYEWVKRGERETLLQV